MLRFETPQNVRHSDSASRDFGQPTQLSDRLPELTAMLVRMGFPHHEAEDAAQDAMLVALRYRQSGKDRTVKNPRTWLRAVAVRAACKGLLKRLPCDSVAVASAVAGGDPCDEAARRDEAVVLLSAVRELPDGPRQVLEFCTLGATLTGRRHCGSGPAPAWWAGDFAWPATRSAAGSKASVSTPPSDRDFLEPSACVRPRDGSVLRRV